MMHERYSRAFDKAYTNLYKKLHDGVDVEIVGVSVSVSAYLVFVKAAETTGVECSRPVGNRSHLYPV